MNEDLKAGRYKILQKIDEGGMGVVNRAHDLRLNCPVALKQIKAEHLHDAQYRRRLSLEAQAAAGISHPGIARAFDFVDDGREAFIVYEFVEGVSLRKRLTQHRFTTLEILDLGIKVADALAAAHEQGFIHRDLKPENIMLTPRSEGSDRVKVLDFGLAKRISFLNLPTGIQASLTTASGITQTGTALIGTVAYMSPEQLRMETADHRCDIYALGLILYEMATCVNPFRGRDDASTIANILTLDPPLLSERSPASPPGLDHIIRKCLRKNREERYPTAKELLVDLSKLRQEVIQPPAAAPATDAQVDTPLAISRGVARAVFLTIQAGYLVMYGFTGHYLPRHPERLGEFIPTAALAPVGLLLALLGAAFRLYLISAVAFDYQDSGRLFQRVFPIVLAVDALWAAAPLLLFKELGGLAWLCVVGLAYLPFSQRSLMFSAYAPRGGKTSGVRAGTPA